MYEVHGYFGNPDKRRNGLRWTANDVYATLEEALVLAGEWLETERYEFTEITDKKTGRRVGQLMGMGGK
jgi:hypothetical protein